MVICLALALSLAGCADSPIAPGASGIHPSAAPVSNGVSVSPSTPAIVQGATVQLTASGSNGNVHWSSSDAAVATVSSSGLVSGVAPGIATITARQGNRWGTAVVTVTAPSGGVHSVVISPDTTAVRVGATSQKTAVVRDANGNPLSGRTITWSSSNGAVATVNASGVVSAVAAGSAMIQATVEGVVGAAVVQVPVGAGPPAGAISVTSFGAVGNGSTDNTTAFRNAIQSAGQQRVPLFVPAGRYLIRSDLTLDYPVEIVGEGHESSIITSNRGTTRILVRQSGTAFRDIGFEDMIEPIALVSRSGYMLENLRFERCRFENMMVVTSNRGVIGLSSGSASQRPHRIHNLVIEGCVFRNIDAYAINIRGNISSAQIVHNQFLNIVNSRGEGDSMAGGFAIRLGESSDDSGQREIFAPMTHHRIEGNVIRTMRKNTRGSNLIGLLLYGNYHLVQNNLFEDIDGTPQGLDTNAMYVRGAYNRILHNTIRNVRGADDDGALALKGGLDLGSVHNVIAHNTIEDIHGMSAIEVSTTNLHLHDNMIRNAHTRGFLQRGGAGLLMENNTWVHASIITRSPSGTTTIADNRFVESNIVLSQFDGASAMRDAVNIHRNHFERAGAGRTIGLGNGVEEQLVSLVGNTFRAPPSGEHVVDLMANGRVLAVERYDNIIEGPFRYRGP